MPHLFCKGLKETEVIELSNTLSRELSQIMNTPEDWFLFEHIERKRYVQGKAIENSVFIEVWYFGRTKEVQDKSALAIDAAIKALGYANVEICFYIRSKQSYYVNGEHC